MGLQEAKVQGTKEKMKQEAGLSLHSWSKEVIHETVHITYAEYAELDITSAVLTSNDKSCLLNSTTELACAFGSSEPSAL